MTKEEKLSKLFDEPTRALEILHKQLDPNHLNCSRDYLLEELGYILRDAEWKHGKKLKCIMLENELDALKDPPSNRPVGRPQSKPSSTCDDWGESFDDCDPEDWEDHYDPGPSYTDPDD